MLNFGPRNSRLRAAWRRSSLTPEEKKGLTSLSSPMVDRSGISASVRAGAGSGSGSPAGASVPPISSGDSSSRPRLRRDQRRRKGSPSPAPGAPVSSLSLYGWRTAGLLLPVLTAPLAGLLGFVVVHDVALQALMDLRRHGGGEHGVVRLHVGACLVVIGGHRAGFQFAVVILPAHHEQGRVATHEVVPIALGTVFEKAQHEPWPHELLHPVLLMHLLPPLLRIGDG